MKALIAKLAVVLIFASGQAFAAIDASQPAASGAETSSPAQVYAGNDSDGEYGGCNKSKWEDT